jgi:HD-GYP domain-containing protein (c-di-GMP phosphodiesterase class II)
VASELEERRIDVADLEIGMFVCRLDRPWAQTSFPLQGVHLASEGDIADVRRQCRHVFVDTRRQAVEYASSALTRTALSDARFRTGIRYSDTVPIRDELPRARDAVEGASALIDAIFKGVTSGRELSAERVEQAVRPVVASILRSPDAYFWVEGLRRQDSYSYRHALGCSALAAAFGRHMGFAEETIISLAAGGLLMDVGKTQLPESLLQRSGPLNRDELAIVRGHVAHGLRILQSSSITDSDVNDIVRTHHERYDGSGYPDGLIANVAPITGRMLAIIDAYDAMTNVRPYRAAVSRHQALRQIYASRGTLFQAELVEQFQVCLGVYPTGSLVELGTGEIAVVMVQNRIRRLRPRVVVVTDPDKRPLAEYRVVDLMDPGENEAPVDIVRSLAAGDHAIDTRGLFLG